MIEDRTKQKLPGLEKPVKVVKEGKSNLKYPNLRKLGLSYKPNSMFDPSVGGSNMISNFFDGGNSYF